MKKEIFLIAIFSLLILQIASASVADTGEAIEKEIGTSINKIETGLDDVPKDIEEVKSRYLTQEWGELVNKNKYLGPVHNFLKSFFLIEWLFGEPYSLSLTFFIIIIFWLFIGLKSGSLLKASGIITGGIATTIGFLLSIILAQVKIYRTIAEFITSIILKESNWWIRLILSLVVIILFALLIYLSQALEKLIKQNIAAGKADKLEQTRKELEAFSKEMKK